MHRNNFIKFSIKTLTFFRLLLFRHSTTDHPPADSHNNVDDINLQPPRGSTSPRRFQRDKVPLLACVIRLALSPAGCRALATLTRTLTGSRMHGLLFQVSTFFSTGQLKANDDENGEIQKKTLLILERRSRRGGGWRGHDCQTEASGYANVVFKGSDWLSHQLHRHLSLSGATVLHGSGPSARKSTRF